MTDSQSGVDPLSLVIGYKGGVLLGASAYDPGHGHRHLPAPAAGAPPLGGEEAEGAIMVASDFQETKNVNTIGANIMPNTRFKHVTVSVGRGADGHVDRPAERNECAARRPSTSPSSRARRALRRRRSRRQKKSRRAEAGRCGPRSTDWNVEARGKGKHSLRATVRDARRAHGDRASYRARVQVAASPSSPERRPASARRLARALAAHGWRCVLVARREERLRALAEELDGEFEVCDVSDRDAVEAMAARVLERASADRAARQQRRHPWPRGLPHGDPERIEQVMRTNYLGGVWCLRAFLPALEAARPRTS